MGSSEKSILINGGTKGTGNSKIIRIALRAPKRPIITIFFVVNFFVLVTNSSFLLLIDTIGSIA
jgi:hypothetical protein